MAFWREKTIKGHQYQYLVESYRSEGKVKHRTIISGRFDQDQQDLILLLWKVEDWYPNRRGLIVHLLKNRHPTEDITKLLSGSEGHAEMNKISDAAGNLKERGIIQTRILEEDERIRWDEMGVERFGDPWWDYRILVLGRTTSGHRQWSNR
jgi:hypothetical protein